MTIVDQRAIDSNAAPKKISIELDGNIIRKTFASQIFKKKTLGKTIRIYTKIFGISLSTNANEILFFGITSIDFSLKSSVRTIDGFSFKAFFIS